MTLASAVALLLWLGQIERRIDGIGTDDFANIWAGPRALLVGRDPYDPLAWHQTARDVGTMPPVSEVYLYPPWVAVALLPLGALPLPLATLIWTVAGFAAAACALRALCVTFLPERPAMHASVAATLVLSGPAVSTLLTGQWSFVLVAALSVGAVSLRRRRPIAAALAFLAMLAKPQLFALALPALAVRALWPAPAPVRRAGRRGMLVGAAATVMLIAASWVIVPSWWPAWPVYTARAQLAPEHVTVSTVLVHVFGPSGEEIGNAASVAALAVGFLFHPRSTAWIPIWLTLSIVAAPYANPYDLLVLVVPLTVAVGAVADRPWRAALVAYAGAAILVVGATLLYELGALAYGSLVPAMALAVITVALWPVRKATDATGI